MSMAHLETKNSPAPTATADAARPAFPELSSDEVDVVSTLAGVPESSLNSVSLDGSARHLKRTAAQRLLDTILRILKKEFIAEPT